MQEIVTLGVSGGFNTDVDKPFYDGNTYLMAENFTATTKGGSTMGSLENSKGNDLVPNISFGIGYELVGYANVVKDIVFFVSDGTNSKIYHYTDDEDLILKYSDEGLAEKLEFSLEPENKIVAVGRQELLEINKVYWVDGIHELRYINLDRDYSDGSGGFISIESLNIIPEVDHTTGFTTGDKISLEVVPSGGSYTTGKVFYSYQFYRNNGASSTFSPPFGGINVAQYAGNKDGGSDLGDNSSCAIDLRIVLDNDVDPEVYNRIRVVAILYSEEGTPQINIVKELPFFGNSISIIDNGDVVGELTQEEFETYNQTSYISDAIASKDNYLFLGNIEENTFSSPVLDDPTHADYWDARAFRYANDGFAYLKRSRASHGDPYVLKVDTNGLVVDSTDSNIPIGQPVPYDFDCYNSYNNNYSTSLSGRSSNGLGIEAYKYKYNGSSIGGEGVNLSYNLENFTKIIDKSGSLTDSVVINNQSDTYEDNFGGKYFFTECQDGEVYRIGIRFFNNKGQSSFVKWIGDVLWEEAVDDRYELSGSDIISNAKGLTVSLNQSSLPKDPQIVAFQIVRAPRTSSDKSVVTEGVMERTITDSSINRPFKPVNSTLTGSLNSNLFKLISPEILVNDFRGDLQSYKVVMYNQYLDYSEEESILQGGNNRDRAFKLTGKNMWSQYFGNMWEISDSVLTTPTYPTVAGSEIDYSIGGDIFRNETRIPRTTSTYGSGATSYVVKLAFDPTIVEGSAVRSASEFRLIANVESSRYGGTDYYSILNTQYIPFSLPTGTGKLGRCLYGDTYSNMFYYHSCNLQEDVNDSKYAINYFGAFPVQSTIDLRRRLDRILDYRATLSETDGADTEQITWLQETVDLGIKFQPEKYPLELGDLYRYNTIHSTETNTGVSFSKPFDFIESPHSTTKVISSQKKVNGENIDSWLRFLPNDFIEVDASFGPLNNLLTMDNGLFFWQDKAFGKLAVNERSLIEDGSGAKLALGTGGVLERYDYYSTEIGNIEKYNISKSENAMIWLYTPKKAVYRFSQQLQELSTTKGVSKLIYDNTPTYPITISDHENQESLITINGKVLVYDWFFDKFTGVYTYEPEWFVPEFDGNFLSSPDSMSFYRHNSDTQTRANYYGIDNKSSIQHILSSDFNTTKVFDVLNWHSTSIGKTLDPIEFQSKYDLTSGTLSSELFSIFFDSLYGERIRVVFDLQLLIDFPENNLQGLDVRSNYDAFVDVRLNIPIGTTTTSYDTGVIPGAISPDTQVFNSSVHTFSGDYFIKSGTRFRLSNVKAYNEAGDQLPIASLVIDGSFDADLFGDDVNLYDDTFDTYRIYNDYQNTDWQPISWKRKERSYTTIVPRDRVNQPQSANVNIFTNLDEDQQFKRRIRDKYAIIDMVYTNKPNTVFSFPYINVGIRRSIR